MANNASAENTRRNHFKPGMSQTLIPLKKILPLIPCQVLCSSETLLRTIQVCSTPESQPRSSVARGFDTYTRKVRPESVRNPVKPAFLIIQYDKSHRHRSTPSILFMG
ncbi:hypothetical protein RRG08_034306 [Elysia crispata]|uniref:Uncharacterized protein n=1 Tax=Elysia crispata TaxID=231223 RepID=A0AAE1DZS4_9GAST|nr:hypothetical protein RRG08_034306 [Elysia crispata]